MVSIVVCACVCSVVVFGADIIIVVSSAYVYIFSICVVVIISFIYSRNRVVDRGLPWGIPCVIVCGFEVACCVCVYCVLFLKYDVKNVMVSWWNSYCFCSFCSSIMCDMESYALVRSIYNANVIFFLFFFFYNVVYYCLLCYCNVGVGAECVLFWVYDVVC